MLTVSRIAASLLLLLSVFNPPARAQERAQESRTAPIVTAAVGAERVRFTAPSNSVSVRLEVYAADGRRLFDSGFKPGSLLDWRALDQEGQPYPAGAYLCVVAVKSLSGRVSHKLGSLNVSAAGAVSLEPAEARQLGAAQLEASGGAEAGSALTVLREGEAVAVTSVANTGAEGEITRGKGALSFRLGDFYGGKDVEQMRLTGEGNLGIGTANPRARLDVNGVIRAQEGIQFSDGTLLNLSPKGGLSVTSPDGATGPFGATATTALAGTGTQNRLAKWTDNSGTLGDSSIIEDGRGAVIIGSTSADASLQVNGNQFVKPAGATPSFRFLAGFDPARTVMLTTDGGAFGWQMAPAKATSETLVQVIGQTYATAASRGEFGVYLGTNAGSAFKVFRRGGPELMRVNRSGNVGIGTAAPQSRLHVAGDLRLSGTGSGVVFPDGTKQTTAGASRMTGTSIVSAINDTATTGTISDSRLSYNVALLGNVNFFNNDQVVNGSVGIGTRTPGERLEVVGNVKLTGEGSGIVFPDGTKQTTAWGGGNYIQNTTAQQANSNFNISGDGTAGGTLTADIVHAKASYYLRGTPILLSEHTNLVIGSSSPTDGRYYFGNTFVGVGAGQSNKGSANTFIGSGSGSTTTTGYGNTFVGEYSGGNTTGSHNTLLGAESQLQGTDLTNATAIGYRAAVSQSDSIVLGSIYDTRVGIGTPAPQFKLHVTDYSNTGLRVQTEAGGGTVASFGGFGAFEVDAQGTRAGRFVIGENGYVGIGWPNPSNRLDVNGMIGLSQLGSAGTTSLCLNSSNQISTCSSSLRYKTNVAGLSAGLDLIGRLRPVTFDWKEGGAHDLGLVAEEVAAVEPLLALRNQKGEVEGVKYDRLNVVLVNAVKEQQAQIKSQADALAALRQENLEMKKRLATLEQSLRQQR